MRRLTTVTLTSVLIAAAVLRSHLMPLCLLALMGALVGLLVATQTEGPGDLVRTPAQVAAVAIVLVGIGQFGVLGFILGVGLFVTAAPSPGGRPEARARRPPTRRTPH
jgi:hypothetical protein